jgi:hypothetical protein
MKILWAMFAIVGAAIFVVTFSLPHYAAPLTCVFYALLVQGIRHLRTMRISSLHLGIALSRVAVVLLVLDTGTHLCYRVCDPLLFPCQGNPDRTALAQRLQHLAGKHLVIVRYAELHNPHNEWVFNGADIDGGKVIWARDMDAAQNTKLLAYFADRQVWLVQPDKNSRELLPYNKPLEQIPITLTSSSPH